MLIICSLNIGLFENSFKTRGSPILLSFKLGIVSVSRSESFNFEEIRIGASTIVNIESIFSILDNVIFIFLTTLMYS